MRLDIPGEKTLVHETTIPIRWADMDALQHVNNANYFRYLEIARMEWLESVGSLPGLQNEGPVIVNAFCNFIRQLEYPGTVRAKTYVASPGRTSFDTYVTLERADEPDVIYAAGGATIVWVNYRQQKSVPLPDKLLPLLG